MSLLIVHFALEHCGTIVGMLVSSWVALARAWVGEEEEAVSDADEVFARAVELRSTAKELRAVASSGLSAELHALLRDVGDKQLRLVKRLQGEEAVIGDPLQSHTRIVLVVLGCAERAIQDARVRHACGMLGSNRTCVDDVLLCGGNGEAEAMADGLKGYQYEGNLLLECDSLDTVGNALFGALLLRKKGFRDDVHLAVVTSRFHARRSHKLWRRAWAGPVSVIGVADAPLKISVDTLDVNPLTESFDEMVLRDARLRRAVSELRSEHLTQRTLFSLSLPSGGRVELDRGDVDSLLILLFARHALYKTRLDLLQLVRAKYCE